MALVRFLAGLLLAATLHFAGVRIVDWFPRAFDLFLLAAVIEGRRGQPTGAMLAGLAAGLATDGVTGGPYGLFGFADTLVAWGVAVAARQLVVQRTTSLAALFAAAAAAQQAIVAGLALLWRRLDGWSGRALAVLLLVPLAVRLALGGALGLEGDRDLAAVDGAPAGDDAVGVGTLGQADIVGPVPRQQVEFVE